MRARTARCWWVSPARTSPGSATRRRAGRTARARLRVRHPLPPPLGLPPAAARAAAAASAATATPGGSGALQGAHNRRFVIAGRYCEHVFAEIGAADRQAPVTAAPGAAAGTRYTYEPRTGDPQMRTVFTCADGKVADVERTLVK